MTSSVRTAGNRARILESKMVLVLVLVLVSARSTHWGKAKVDCSRMLVMVAVVGVGG